MSLWPIPRSTVYTLKPGASGLAVWSLQVALNGFETDIAADGDYGPATTASVKSYQRRKGLTADGVAGPATQGSLARAIISPLRMLVPAGLLEGFAEMEGGNVLGAVNWSVAGGVDCGLFQRRVYDEDAGTTAVVQRAFNTSYQAKLLADRLVELRSIFLPRAGTRDAYVGVRPEEKAWRLAALNHNYPSAADRLSRTPIHELDAYWTTPQTWVTSMNFRFPDGAAVRTPLDWCHMYAGVLGGAHGHKGNVTKYVMNFSV